MQVSNIAVNSHIHAPHQIDYEKDMHSKKGSDQPSSIHGKPGKERSGPSHNQAAANVEHIVVMGNVKAGQITRERTLHASDTRGLSNYTADLHITEHHQDPPDYLEDDLSIGRAKETDDSPGAKGIGQIVESSLEFMGPGEDMPDTEN